MKSFKPHRFELNPKEKQFHDEFIKMFDERSSTLSKVVFGELNDNNEPKDYLTPDEENICLNIVQWLGSSVGQHFLNKCGFYQKKD